MKDICPICRQEIELTETFLGKTCEIRFKAHKNPGVQPPNCPWCDGDRSIHSIESVENSLHYSCGDVHTYIERDEYHQISIQTKDKATHKTLSRIYIEKSKLIEFLNEE